MSCRLILASSLALALAACGGRQEEPARNAAADAPATAAAPTNLEDVPLIPRDALFGNPERASVQISPDGRYLSWIAPVDGVLNVWVAPADDVDAARAVTSDDARGIRQYFWAHQPDTLLYLRDSGGDENFHLYAVDLESGESRDLTPFENTRAFVSGVSHLHPESVLVSMNDRDPQWHDLYRVDLASGERTLVEENTEQFAGYLADADYQVRLAMRARDDGGQDVLRPDGEGGWELAEEIPFDDFLSTSYVGFTTDGETAYLLESRERNTTALVAVDMDSGEKTVVFENPRADVDDALTDPVTGEVQAASSNYLREEWTAIDDAIAADLEKLEAIGPGVASVSARTQDDSTWIVTYSAAERPAVYYRYDRGGEGGGELTELFSSRPALDGQPLVPQWPQEIVSRDGLDLVSYLTLPAHADPDADGNPDAAVPMVLFVHGGPWARDSYGYSAWPQWLANRGYAVLQVNYRGSTGFGKDFVNRSNHEWAGKMHDDLMDAVQWAVQQGVTTEDQVAIMGGSYGGYATLVGMTFTPEAFKCGVDIVGPSNLITLFETFPAYWASFMEQWYRRVGDPRTEEGRKLLLDRSPITHVDRISRPLLIGQGANDPRVVQAESDQIVAAMQEKDIPVTYVLFPDEGHGFARPENSKAFNAVAEGFLSTCLGGRAQPIGEDFAGSSITVPAGAEGVPGLAEALETHEPQIRK
ncbi:S9 family peptidase [Luteimonas sp. RD2P54]|uniref:S9 family peptidase n=1 Tax=Luteimonas endophytica TaxID=3042023 RepID=A0ABT6J8F8_9GAMM|nr:S9 family peptidase [Luteimonas endophytica]MDH5822463.1 S9 family peptidase [Luteimonas endophytica]